METNLSTPGHYDFRTGNLPDIQIESPINMSTDLEGIREYMLKGIANNHFAERDCILVINQKNLSAELTIWPEWKYKKRVISGRMEINPDFEEFHVNESHDWDHNELAHFIRINSNYIATEQEFTKLLKALLDFDVNVERKRKDLSNLTTADRETNMKVFITSSIPSPITLKIPILLSEAPVLLPVNIYIHPSTMNIRLISHDLKNLREDLKKTAMENFRKEMQSLPNLCILNKI